MEWAGAEAACKSPALAWKPECDRCKPLHGWHFFEPPSPPVLCYSSSFIKSHINSSTARGQQSQRKPRFMGKMLRGRESESRKGGGGDSREEKKRFLFV